MLGGPSALEQPSTSWGSTGAQSTAQPLPESPAIGSIPHCSHPSTSYPHASLTPSNSAKTDHCSLPSTSFAETPRQSSSASSEEPVGDMTTSALETASPYRRLHLTFKLPARKAQRLKRIASFQPQTLRRIGVSRLKVGKDGESMTIADPPAPPPPPPPPAPRPEVLSRPEQIFDRIEPPRPQPQPGQFAPHPGVPQPPPPETMQMQPRPPQMASNSSPLLVNLLSNQPQGREPPPTNGPPSVHPAAAQRSFSPYQYPPQQGVPGPHPVTPGAMDPNQMAAMQQHQERQRQMLIQQQMQAQHAAAMQNHPPPGTPGCGVPQQQPFFQSGPPRPQVPVNYPQGHPQQAPPQPMYNPQQAQRMAPPQYPTQPQMPPAAMAQPAQFMARAVPEPEPAPSKKKRKPTKRQQQKEAAEMAAQNAAQQQFMVQQGMIPQQHMQHPGMPMMGQNFGPQGYPPQYGYPPGTPQQQQQIWQHQMAQQRMMYQHQQQAAAGAQWHQRPHVPYPPGTPMEGPASVHPVSQRPSSEFGTDGTSPMTPHSFPQQQPGMVNGAFMRHDSHGNLFNFNQQATTSDPLDQFLQKDDTDLGDIGLDDIDIKPMGDLGTVIPADILDEASSSSSTALEKQPAPSTPNGDRIDSSIASVVEMVSKSNATQPTMTNVSQATAMTGNTTFRGFGNGTHQPQYSLQHTGNEQRPPSKAVKVENGAVLANGHHQLPNGATRRSTTNGGGEEANDETDQFVKRLMMADEERRKAVDAGSKAKTQRKSRKKDTAMPPQSAIS